MHRALAISELLSHILGDLYNGSRESIQDMASASRVCKVFRDAALDFLWRHIDSLFPLLRLLPLETREEHHDSSRLSKVISSHHY